MRCSSIRPATARLWTTSLWVALTSSFSSSIPTTAPLRSVCMELESNLSCSTPARMTFLTIPCSRSTILWKRSYANFSSASSPETRLRNALTVTRINRYTRQGICNPEEIVCTESLRLHVSGTDPAENENRSEDLGQDERQFRYGWHFVLQDLQPAEV